MRAYLWSPNVASAVQTMLGGFAASAAEYAQAANKQLQSMQTLFPSNELEKKLTDATSNEPQARPPPSPYTLCLSITLGTTSLPPRSLL